MSEESVRMMRFWWSRLKRRCGDESVAIDEAIVGETPWRWMMGRLKRWDDEIDDGSSSGEVYEGRRAVAMDYIVMEEAPVGQRWGGGRRRVGFHGWSREVMAAWDFEWGFQMAKRR